MKVYITRLGTAVSSACPFLPILRPGPIFFFEHLGIDDGMSALDVTSPLKPAYCFVSTRGLQEARYDTKPHGMPLGAAQYVQLYFPVPQSPNPEDSDSMSTVNLVENQAYMKLVGPDWVFEKSVTEAIASLDDMPLIREDALWEVWDETGDEKILLKETVDGPQMSFPALPPTIDSMRKQHALTGEDVEALILALQSAAATTAIINLSEFPLTTTQLMTVLQRLERFKQLDFSGVEAVNKDTLPRILTTHTLLEWVNISRTSVSKEDLMHLMTESPLLFCSIGSVIHPVLFAGDSPQPLHPNPDKDHFTEFPIAFRISGHYEDRGFHVSLPYFEPHQLLQNLTEIFYRFNTGSDSDLGQMNISAMLSASLRCNDQDRDWLDRDILLVPATCSLEDSAKFPRPRPSVYHLVISVQASYCDTEWKLCYRYGVFTSRVVGDKRKKDGLVDVNTFATTLQERGAHLSDSGAVRRLGDECASWQVMVYSELDAQEKSNFFND